MSASRTNLATAAVAVLVVLAGCGAGSGSSDGVNTVAPALQGTPSPSPTPTRTPAYPPGVGPNGVNAFDVAFAHGLALVDTPSTVRRTRTVRWPNGTVRSRESFVARSAGERLLYRTRTAGNPPQGLGFGLPNYTVWRNASGAAVRIETADGPRVADPVVADRRYPTFDTGRPLVAGALTALEPRLAGIERSAEGQVFVLRGTAERATFLSDLTVRNASLVVRVTERGVVQSYRLRYTIPRDGGLRVTARFETSEVGSTAVDRPPWVDRLGNGSTGTAAG